MDRGTVDGAIRSSEDTGTINWKHLEKPLVELVSLDDSWRFDWEDLDDLLPEGKKTEYAHEAGGEPPVRLGKYQREVWDGKHPALTDANYQLDSYLLFLERAVDDLLALDGFYGMIIPNPWLTNVLQKSIRQYVTAETRIHEVVHFLFPVFPKVTVDTEILLLQKADPEDWQVVVTVVESLSGLRRLSEDSEVTTIHHHQAKWNAAEGDVINIFTSVMEERLASKRLAVSDSLSSLYDINIGI